MDDDDVRGVVADRADRGEQGGHDAPAGSQRAVSLVELPAHAVVPVHQERGQAEKLDLLCRHVAGADVAEIVELAALRRPAVQERISEGSEMGLAEQRRQDGHNQEDEEPRHIRRQRRRQRDQRHQVL